MKILDRLLYSQNWNIGFCEQSPENLIASKKLNKVHWMKHSYKDRWFADPFILNVTDDEIIVFVEECPIENPKGILCELHIDRKSYKLRERYILLELDTHLSYPAIIEYEGKTYVYPENGKSGKLNLYEYDENNHCLINPKCILSEAVADSTILQKENLFYLIATKYPNTQEKAFVYQADSIFGPYTQVYEKSIQDDLSCSRPAGNWISLNDALYRPSQDCVKNYGNALSLMRIESISPEYKETKLFKISPMSHKYKRGVHTLNYSENLCVIDGCGYLYPLIADIYNLLSRLKHYIIK